MDGFGVQLNAQGAGAGGLGAGCEGASMPALRRGNPKNSELGVDSSFNHG